MVSSLNWKFLPCLRTTRRGSTLSHFMAFFLAPVIAFYHYALQPIPALAWLGLPISVLDVAGALRLAVVLRQVRELYHNQHVAKLAVTSHRTKSGGKPTGKAQRTAADEPPEPRSRVRDFLATLVIVHGGEAIVGALLFPYHRLPECCSLDFCRGCLFVLIISQHPGLACNLRSPCRAPPPSCFWAHRRSSTSCPPYRAHPYTPKFP